MYNTSGLNHLRELYENMGKIGQMNDDEFKAGNYTRQDFLNFMKYNTNAEKNTSWKDIFKRVFDGSWTDADKAALESIGIKLGNNSSTTTASSASSDGSSDPNNTKVKSYWAKYAPGLDYSKLNNYISIDKDGNITALDTLKSMFNGATGGYVFNDDWASRQTNLDLLGLNGYTLYGNNLYKTDTAGDTGSALYTLFHNSGFYDKNKNNDFVGANNIIRYDWSNIPESSSKFDPTRWASQWMSTFDSDKFRFRNLTGNISKEYLKTNPEFLKPGEQLIEYWDGNTNRDMFGRPILDKTKNYAVINSNGDFLRNIDLTNVRIDPSLQVADTRLPEIVSEENSPYNGMYQREIYDNQGRKLATLWLDSNKDHNNRNMFLNMEIWKPGSEAIGGMDYTQLKDGTKFFRLPGKLAQYIYRNPDFLNKMLSDQQLMRNFSVTLSNMVNSATGELLGKLRGRLDENQMKRLISDPKLATELWSLLEKLGDNSTYNGALNYEDFAGLSEADVPTGRSQSARENYWLINPYAPSQIPEHQAGGAIKQSGEIKNTNSKIITGNNSQSGERPRMTDFGKLSASDIASLASAAMDIGAIATSGSGFASWVAPLIGATSSLTQFGSDIARDGLDAGDFKNLALNLGLDAVSIVPFAGASAGVTKVAKTLHKFQNVLTPIMIAYGGKELLSSFYKILDGSATIDDYKSVSVGLTAAFGLGKNISNMRKSKYVDPGNPKLPTEKPEIIASRKKKAVDDWLKAHPENAQLNGVDNKWISNGQVNNYDEAYEGLLNIKDFADKNKNLLKNLGVATESVGNSAKNISNSIFSSQYNPFSKRYKYDYLNREFPEIQPASPGVPANKQGGMIKKAVDGVALGDTFPSKKISLSNNDISNMLDAIKAASEAIAINKNYRNTKSAIDKSIGYINNMKTTELPYAILDLNQIDRSQAVQNNILNQSKIVTSSPELYAAQNLAIAGQKNAIEEKANAMKSDAISKYNEYNRKVDLQNRASRAQLNNQKMQYLIQMANAIAQAKNSRDLAYANLINKDLTGTQTKLNKDELVRQQYNQTAAAYNAAAGRDKDIFTKYGSTWNTMSKEDRAKYYNDINTWVQSEHGDDFAAISAKWALNRMRSSLPNQNTRMSIYDFPEVDLFVQQEAEEPKITTHRFGIGNPSYKKHGGNLTKIYEQLFLDNNKETVRAISKLNDNVVKILLNIKK